MLGVLASIATAPEAVAAPAFLPPLQFTALDGSRTPVDSLLGERLTLVLFWSTPCQSCLDRLRWVERFAQEHSEEGVSLFMVSVDAPRNRNLIAPFLHRFGFTSSGFIDPDREVFRKCGGREAPYLIALNPAREIVGRSQLLGDDALDSIASLLATSPGGAGSE